MKPKKRTYKPTLDQVIRDAIAVQERLRKKGIIIGFSMTFEPPPEKKPAATADEVQR